MNFLLDYTLFLVYLNMNMTWPTLFREKGRLLLETLQHIYFR